LRLAIQVVRKRDPHAVQALPAAGSSNAPSPRSARGNIAACRARRRRLARPPSSTAGGDGCATTTLKGRARHAASRGAVTDPYEVTFPAHFSGGHW